MLDDESTLRAYAAELSARRRERGDQARAALRAAKRTLDDYYDSDQPRCMRHTLDELRRIVCEGSRGV